MCVFYVDPILILVAISGISLGVFSAVWPAKSIALYQRMMAFFNWKVEPIRWQREVLTTRILGIVMTILSLAIFIVRACSGKFPSFG